MSGSAQPDTPFPPRNTPGALPEPAVGNASLANGAAAFDGHELDSALQLLIERAQYITGATGAALALTRGEEMVCRASAGSSAPAIGARLQVRSGLSGESISRKQLLRCDNAETDPRVNLETCRALGIASIVVLPLLTRTGEVLGIFELFSDHPYAFEERDLIALERMADLTMTALDLAERKPRTVAAPPVEEPVVIPPAPIESEIRAQAALPPTPAPADDVATAGVGRTLPSTGSGQALSDAVDLSVPQPDHPLGAAQVHSALFQEGIAEPPAAVPEAMRRVQKCATCGFPVSEGRTLCLDCENKRPAPPDSANAVVPEFVPAFLDASPPANESWIANHVNILAVVVLVLSIVVAVVVFR